MKKRIALIFALLAVGCLSARAQEQETVEIPAAVDSTLLGRSILSVLGPGVQVNQSAEVRQALDEYVKANARKSIPGFRIRVFYDNGPQARAKSESIENALRSQLNVAVYRSFESPNYKVTVGDFRSRDEALRVYNLLKGTYPTAYIIKETINFPR
ncbi:MAG: SPOR domain-containing protein [Bacteroidales bacterium]|nr:SPOR domain-containing protein [Bacteroidales bacterium]